MLRKSSHELQWLEFELFQEIPHFVHAVFLRHGGFSEGEYGSLNTVRGPGESAENVLKNFEKIRSVLGLSKIYSAWQQHGKEVIHIEQRDCKGDLYPNQIKIRNFARRRLELEAGNAGAEAAQLQGLSDAAKNESSFDLGISRCAFEELPHCDALMTAVADVGLLIKHADCQAAVIVDPIRRVLANVHAGWRGNVLNIYREAIRKMRLAFGSLPEDLLVGISPSLGPDAAEFVNYRTEFPEPFWEFQHKPNYFNLWELSRSQLEECGILPHHIEIASICTYANPQDFFSYRRVKESGRHGTVAAFNSY